MEQIGRKRAADLEIEHPAEIGGRDNGVFRDVRKLKVAGEVCVQTDLGLFFSMTALDKRRGLLVQ